MLYNSISQSLTRRKISTFGRGRLPGCMIPDPRLSFKLDWVRPFDPGKGLRGSSFVASTNLISCSRHFKFPLLSALSSRAIPRPSFRNVGHIFTDSLVCLNSFFSLPRASTRILTPRRPMELVYPEKSYDRSGAESFDIDHQTHTEPHNLVRGCRPRLARQAISAPLNSGDSIFTQ